MLGFLNGEDKKADDELSWALENCPLESVRNQECVDLLLALFWARTVD
jgi:hypothetical protein